MKTKNLIPILLSFLFLVSCKKDPLPPDPKTIVMPPLTHQGINSFGCYIDGELYVPNKGDSYWDLPPLSGSFNEITRDLGLQSTRYINFDTGESDDIKIRANITGGVGVYNFRYNEESGSDGYTNWYGERCDYYYREYPGFDLGKLTITHLDETKNIISGTFYINLINQNCETGDTIMHITDGRFDIRY